MDERRPIFVIFDCDQWKSWCSMRFIMVSDEDNLERNLAVIKKKREYSDEDMETYIYIENAYMNDF